MNKKREELKRKEKLILHIQNMNIDSAIFYTNSEYEKALVYTYLESYDKAISLFKMNYKDKNFFPIFILLNTGNKNDARTIAGKLLGLNLNPPLINISKLYYSLIFDTTLQFYDSELEPYIYYLNIESGKDEKDSLLKKYPDTSPAFIIRNIKR